MGLRPLLIVASLSLLLHASAAEARGQCCAVGGSARVKIYDKERKAFTYRTEGIRVEVKGHSISDSTNRSGVYVLYIPREVGKRVDLRFTYDKLEEYALGISNEVAQNKVVEVVLKTRDAIALGDTPEEVQLRAMNYQVAGAYASVQKDAALSKWAQAGLRTLREIAAELSAGARTAAERNDASEASTLFERAIVFRKSLDGSQSPALAQTYEDYSAFLSKSGDAVKAAMYSGLAAQIKGQNNQQRNLFTPAQVLNGKAINKPQPAYPTAAITHRVWGTVNVEVVVDEQGRVVSAKAVSGPQILWEAAVRAAQQARFAPTELYGQPVKVVGILTYNFTPPPARN